MNQTLERPVTQQQIGFTAFEKKSRPNFLPAAHDSNGVVGRPEQIDELVDYIVATRAPEKREFWRGEYEDNARTALFEALTAKGHLSRVEYIGDPEEVHEKILQRLVNGLHAPCLHPHEIKRRKAEIREEMVIWLVLNKIMSGELPPDTEILTDSTFPNEMTEKQAADIGYRPDNKKGMLRATGFEFLPDGKVKRVVEQLSYSNSAAQKSLKLRGITGNDAVLLGRPLVYSRHDVLNGVIDVMRAMDERGQMYGEKPDEITVPYDEVRAVSANREAKIEHFTKELADFEREIDNSDGRLSRQDYYNKLREIVRRICISDPKFTADALGRDVVGSYEKAHEQFVKGDFAGATEIVSATANQEKAVLACGGSSASNIELTAAQTAQMANMSEVEKVAFIEKLKQDSEKLVWRSGYCRVEGCPPKGTIKEVAQCQVCRGCQAIFDQGRDPARVYAERREELKNKEKMAKQKVLSNKAVENTFDYTYAKAVRGDGAFDGVVQIIDRRNGKILVDDRRAARTIWDSKPGIFC